jgi:hypothetical protein
MHDVNTGNLLQIENAKYQTRPLVRWSAPQRLDSNFHTITLRLKGIYGHKPQTVLDASTCLLTTVSHNITSTMELKRDCPGLTAK